MYSKGLSKIWLLAFCVFALSACANNETAPDTDTDASSPIEPADTPDDTIITGASNDTHHFTHKMMKSTGENAFATLAYECPHCTFEQWLAIVPPEGWNKGPAQVLVATDGEMRSWPSLEGVPDTMDFTDEVPGNEYQIIAKNLDARLIEADAGEFVVEAQVLRDTALSFDAGGRVHELTDPEGNIFVLFAFEVDPENVVIPDFQDPGFMGDFTPPEGWSYESRILEEDLVLDTPDIATVLAFRGGVISTWEKR